MRSTICIRNIPNAVSGILWCADPSPCYPSTCYHIHPSHTPIPNTVVSCQTYTYVHSTVTCFPSQHTLQLFFQYLQSSQEQSNLNTLVNDLLSSNHLPLTPNKRPLCLHLSVAAPSIPLTIVFTISCGVSFAFYHMTA
jgi:hypothetical protein